MQTERRDRPAALRPDARAEDRHYPVLAVDAVQCSAVPPSGAESDGVVAMAHGRGAVLTARYLLLACTPHEPKTDSIRSQKHISIYMIDPWDN
jgi:hypothetical protein